MSDKNKQAWAEQFTTDWMLDFNVIAPEYLQKVRMALLVVFPLKSVDVECDIHKLTMKFDIKFDKLKSIFKNKQKILNKVQQILQDRFISYTIEVKEIK